MEADGTSGVPGSFAAGCEAGAEDEPAGALARAAVRAVFRALEFALPDFPFLDPELRARLSGDAANGDFAGPLCHDEALHDCLARLPASLRDMPDDESGTCFIVRMATSEEVSLAHVDEVTEAATGVLAALLRDSYGLAPDRASYLAAEARLAALVRAMERAPRARMEARLAEVHRRGLLTGDRLIAFARCGKSPVFFAAVGQACGLTGEMVEAFLDENGIIALRHILQRNDMAPAVRKVICREWATAAGVAAD